MLLAFKCLKEYHVGYKEVKIEPNNMDWIPEEQDERNLEPSKIHNVFHLDGIPDIEDEVPAPEKLSN